MDDGPSGEGGSVRVAELAASLSLATDLGMGFPWEQGLQATMAAMRLCDLLDADLETRRQTYYMTLLFYSGCTSDAAEDAHIIGGAKTANIVPFIWGTLPDRLRGLLRALPQPDAPPPVALRQRLVGVPRAALVLPEHQRGYCDVGQALATRLGLGSSLAQSFRFLTDRWDGAGVLRRAKGEAIPPAVRIATVARDASFLHVVWSSEKAREAMRSRAGKAHDPAVVAAFLRNADDVLAGDGASRWADVMAAEPPPHTGLRPSQLDTALAAMGDFADLISPSLSGHSSGVSMLSGRAAEVLGMDEPSVSTVRRAALLQDIGRVGVDARIWEKAAPLTPDEWEQVRLHPYYSERVLSRSQLLVGLAEPAACHHEHLDGSGYHRGLPAAMLSAPARVLAAADEFRSVTQPRPYRPALSRSRATRLLTEEANAGRLDVDAVEAVLHVAGELTSPLARPRGLTHRETQVLGLLARGLTTRQVARSLGVAVKTADRHVQNAYRKIGVSSRAGAALFAMEHGLVAWGELPIGERSTAP